ncbi:MAG: NAD(P)/FAD-dependent oxidoreductase [Planctomycetaceae bacterium]|nr:NAD(P)/FAD-dependent oxidoreductase [Planctomycetaceae bacterium]
MATFTETEPTQTSNDVQHHEVVIVGGGTGGITVAAQLLKGWGRKPDVAILEPSERHFYQPAWTLVGAGTYDLEKTARPEKSVIPKGATWIQEAVESFDPEKNRVITAAGTIVEYDILVVAAGIQINWSQIKGLKESLGKEGVCSNYSYETASGTWEALRNFKGGTAIFTQPKGAIKCGGAPQKICYLAEDYLRRKGLRDQSRVIFAAPGKAIFSIDKYRNTLEKVVERKGIETLFQHDLIEILPTTKQAIFENVESGETTSIPYDMIHVTPPQGPPDFIKRSPLADEHGWVDVDASTLQHQKYPNVFALGDASNLPTSRTGAAIRKQAPVLVKNLKAFQKDQPLDASYHGYTSCPVVTGYGSLVLAEFDYDHQPAETFPFDQSKERWSMWILKKYLLPKLYWWGMLKGRA